MPSRAFLRLGGLIEALGPELGGRKTSHPQTGDVTLACPGFNDKNDYDRQTPCDQDFLRKFARDTPADRLHAWFNRQVPRCLRSLGLFDPQGLFIGEASYLFVPDNDPYEDSDLLWFDEHNHPVDPTQVDLSDQRYQQHRCYKLVSLLHINRNLDFFFVVAARVVSGRRHECPILYELVEEVVRAVHQGVIKVLIVDRGRIDGERMGHLKQSTSDRFSAAQIRSTYELRPAIEERHRQYKCFWDLTRMHSCAFSLVVNQALMVLLAYTLVQAHLVLRQRQSLTHGVWERTRQLLSPTLEVVAVYYRQRFCLLTLAEFARILLEIAEPVRGKLRDKLRRIEREQFSLLETARSP
jgi:hypothetical protein